MRVAIPFGFLFVTLTACRASVPAASPNHADVRCITGVPIDATQTSVRSEPAKEIGDGETVGVCGEPETSEARKAFEVVDEHIRQLDLTVDPALVVQELEALRKTTCFALSEGDVSGELTFSNALSLKTWWDDGGARWMEHYLELAHHRYSVVPPTPRATLVAEGNASHPLAPLLCPADASASIAAGKAPCGSETTGWMRRQEAALHRMALAGRRETAESCLETAKRAERVERYNAFRSCLDEVAPVEEALPIGHFKAPTDGWLVMTSPHHQCNEVRAYDLATGAAYILPCRATDWQTGRLPLYALREAAWMMMLADTAERDRRLHAESFEVPEEVPLERPVGGGFGIGFGSCGGTSSPRLWSWMRGKGTLHGQVSGSLNLYACSEGAEKYAAELLAIAEDGFTADCAPANPPAAVAWAQPGPGAAPDKGVDDLLVGTLGDTLAKARSKTACPPTTSRP